MGNGDLIGLMMSRVFTKSDAIMLIKIIMARTKESLAPEMMVLMKEP